MYCTTLTQSQIGGDWLGGIWREKSRYFVFQNPNELDSWRMSSVFRPVDGENNTIIPCCVVIATAKANSNGQTSVIYAVKLNRSDGIEGDPFRLSNRGGRYIWINDTIHKERIKVGSIVKYREFGDLFIYEGNTKKRMVS